MTGSGAFDTALYKQIALRPYFLLVLTPGSLDRCANPGDWLRREIDRAHELRRTVIPLFTETFEWADVDRFLATPDGRLAEWLKSSQGVQLNTAWFKEGVAKLVNMLQPVPATALPAPTPEDHERARRAALQADRAALVTDSQLVEQIRTERQTVGGQPPPSAAASSTTPIGRRWWLIGVVAAVVLLAVAVGGCC